MGIEGPCYGCLLGGEGHAFLERLGYGIGGGATSRNSPMWLGKEEEKEGNEGAEHGSGRREGEGRKEGRHRRRVREVGGRGFGDIWVLLVLTMRVVMSSSSVSDEVMSN